VPEPVPANTVVRVSRPCSGRNYLLGRYWPSADLPPAGPEQL